MTPGGRRSQWEEMEPWDNYFIQPDQLDFLDMLYLINATTAFLTFTIPDGSWSSTSDQNNLLLNEYYDFAANEDVCSRLQDRDQAGLYYTWMPYCSTDQNTVIHTSLLHTDLMDQKGYQSAAYNLAPFPTEPPPYITHLSFLQDALLGDNGSVIYNYFTIFPQSVTEDDKENLIIKNFIEKKSHDEVFSLAGLYQTSALDTAINNIQRVVPYLRFLEINKHIKIHIGSVMDRLMVDMLGDLGLPKERLVSGVIKSKRAYLPQPSHPGFPHVQNIQVLSYLLRHSTKTPQRSSVILIRRNNNHKFENEVEVQKLIEEIAGEHGLKVEVFSDHPAKPLEVIKGLFNRAALVVAPQGASVYNMIFCRAGTYIVEVFCPDSPVYASLRMAHILGHRYYAYTSVRQKNKPCFNQLKLDLKQTRQILQFYMPFVSKLASSVSR